LATHVFLCNSDMGIFAGIRSGKDPSVLKGLNELLKFSIRLAVANSVIDFYHDCIQSRTYPKQFWKALRRSHIYPNEKSLKRYVESKIETTQAAINCIKVNVNQRLAFFDDLDASQKNNFQEYMDTVKANRIRKEIDKLKQGLEKAPQKADFPMNPERYVTNLTELQLSATLLQVLSLGPKFCHKKPKENRLEEESQFESLCEQTSNLVPTSTLAAEQFQSILVDSCYQYRHACDKKWNILTKSHKEELKKLQSNKDIILSRPDKGTGIVLMNKVDYISKMNFILNDRNKFQLLEDEKDQTDSAEKKLTHLLKSLHSRGHLSTTEFETLRPTGSITPRLYGLPKIHKDEAPLRPILDMKGSLYYSVSKWLAKVIEPIRKDLSKHSLKDSFEFVDRIKEKNLKEMQMFSFDVASLFTNVPVIETVNYICEWVEQNPNIIRIPSCSLKELLLRCTMNVQLLFNNKTYHQVYIYIYGVLECECK
ncbi:MAG: hypothetical protein ACRCT5_13160, partial [Tannerellaceae bacterium]